MDTLEKGKAEGGVLFRCKGVVGQGVFERMVLEQRTGSAGKARRGAGAGGLPGGGGRSRVRVGEVAGPADTGFLFRWQQALCFFMLSKVGTHKRCKQGSEWQDLTCPPPPNRGIISISPIPQVRQLGQRLENHSLSRSHSFWPHFSLLPGRLQLGIILASQADRPQSKRMLCPHSITLLPFIPMQTQSFHISLKAWSVSLLVP